MAESIGGHMGAWGANTFENDTACDWTYELADVDDLSLVLETLQAFCGWIRFQRTEARAFPGQVKG